ncbi:hypothetical protein DPMN_147076 [Dreissena polymorpha]|uniref:Uncharacterized protein n=1 Tax=Dreissena polymorpha TaxID=45954 RepID=A0A9D4FD13_DREPO|nr:hypothetical protein DPMN_147076 [Dreissena polymorpha]
MCDCSRHELLCKERKTSESLGGNSVENVAHPHRGNEPSNNMLCTVSFNSG